MNGLAKVPALAAFFALLAMPGVDTLAAPGTNGNAPRGSQSGSRQLTPPGRTLTRPSKTGRRQSTSTGGAFWKTISVLAVLVIVIVFGAKILRKHAPSLGGGIPAEALDVLGKRMIDRGQSVYLLRLGSRILIVGSSSGGLQTLAEVTDPVEIDYLAGLCKPRESSSSIAQGFLALFNRQQAVQSDNDQPEEPERFSNGDPVPQPVHKFDNLEQPQSATPRL